MTFQEKISYCRKKCGFSQEELASRLGVSRQAVSKWETGDAEPEMGKLKRLAAVFDVTTDWLLSDEEPETAEAARCSPENETGSGMVGGAGWVDAIPGVLGKLLRRYGWLGGVYMAVTGALFAGMGLLARFIVSRMLAGFGGVFFGDMGGGDYYYNMFGDRVEGAVSSMAANNPVSIMGTFIAVLGVVMLVGGTVIAVILKKRSGK